MEFIKMHGLGNDFIIVDARAGVELPEKAQIAAMTNRKTGIGCDQFIAILPPENENEACFVRFYNAPDASESEACGNGTRCVAAYLMQDLNVEDVNIRTVAGLLACKSKENGLVTVDMGVPRMDWHDIPLSEERDTANLDFSDYGLPPGTAVNIGNPHIVFFIKEDPEEFALEEMGPQIETHPLFPEKTNVEFCRLIDNTMIRMRVWERGAGVTDACGSGACATAVAAISRGLVQRECAVMLDGGVLYFHWREDDDHILMTGPATFVYKGQIDV